MLCVGETYELRMFIMRRDNDTERASIAYVKLYKKTPRELTSTSRKPTAPQRYFSVAVLRDHEPMEGDVFLTGGKTRRQR